ncbi:MAG: SH3 domain-containing protein [Roseobacter sp.]
MHLKVTKMAPCVFLFMVASVVEASAQSMVSDDAPRRWYVDATAVELRKTPQQDGESLAVLHAGAVLTSLGCRDEARTAWCKVRPLHDGPTGYVRRDRLTPARGPDGVIAVGKDDSPARARKGRFDGKGSVACAQEVGESLSTCDGFVARGTGGDATLVVRFSNGFARTLFFAHGEFTHASATMSGVGTDTDWRVQDGMHVIRVDDQQFEVPVTLILGY